MTHLDPKKLVNQAYTFVNPPSKTIHVEARHVSGESYRISFTSPNPTIADLSSKVVEQFWLNHQTLSGFARDGCAKHIQEFDRMQLLVKIIDDDRIAESHEALKDEVEYQVIFTSLIKDKSSILYLASCPYFNQNTPETLRKHKDFVMDAVRKDGFALRFASQELKGDADVVYQAVENSIYALLEASSALKSDKTLGLFAIKKNHHALKFLDMSLRSDEEICWAALHQSPLMLEYVSDAMKAHKEMVRYAVTQTGTALVYASDHLKADKDIVIQAIKSEAMALGYASDDLKDDREVVQVAIQKNGFALMFASANLKSDRDIVIQAVKKSGRPVLWYASNDLKNDPQLRRLAGLESSLSSEKL